MPLQHRYSHHARRALHHAEDLASLYGHAKQDTAHLLVGVILTEGSLGSQILDIFDLPAPVARVYLKRLMTPHEGIPTPVPQSKAFETALEQAADEAQWLGSHYIGTEHLLLGITRSNLGNAIDLMHLIDISPEQIRRRARHVISDGKFEFSLETVRANAKLSELSRRVLNAAEQRAVYLDHPAVGIGHLLWALSNERRGVTSPFLQQSGFNKALLVDELDQHEPHLFISVEGALNEAINQAARLGSHYVGADHLLLALTLLPNGMRLLQHYQAAPDKINRLLNKHLS